MDILHQKWSQGSFPLMPLQGMCVECNGIGYHEDFMEANDR